MTYIRTADGRVYYPIKASSPAKLKVKREKRIDAVIEAIRDNEWLQVFTQDGDFAIIRAVTIVAVVGMAKP